MIDQKADPKKLAARMRELARAVANQRWGEFDMRVPAEPGRDADCVLMDAAEMLESLDGLVVASEKLIAERDAALLRLIAIRDAIFDSEDNAAAIEKIDELTYPESKIPRVVEEHAHNWTEREGDTQNLYCECGEVSRPLSPVVEGRGPKCIQEGCQKPAIYTAPHVCEDHVTVEVPVPLLQRCSKCGSPPGVECQCY